MDYYNIQRDFKRNKFSLQNFSENTEDKHITEIKLSNKLV